MYKVYIHPTYPNWYEEYGYKTPHGFKIGRIIEIGANPTITIYPLGQKETEGIEVEVYL